MSSIASPTSPPLDDFECFRLPVSSTNRLYVLPFEQTQVVAKIFVESPHRPMEWITRWVPHSARHTIRQASARVRCENERKLLEHWQRCGQSVPSVFNEAPSGLPSERTLVMQWIEFPSLQHWLRDSENSVLRQEAAVNRVFAEMAARHRLALHTNDARLAHLDANTGNVLVGETSIVRIDLEGICETGPVTQLLACEVTKLCRWIARDWRHGSLARVVELLAIHYADLPTILSAAVERTLGGPFQWWHRRSSERKKSRISGEVSKFDVADEIFKRLSRAA